MKLLTKPVWAEGMYLGPHHFQAQSRYFEDSLNFVTVSLWRDAYGFAGLQFDNDALRNGTFALTHARGLFEDGLAFDLPGSDAAPPPREFRALFSPVADHLTMHLAVPVNLHEGRNTSLDNGAAGAARGIRARSRYCPTKIPAGMKSRSRSVARICSCWREAEVTDQFVSLPRHCASCATARAASKSIHPSCRPACTLSASGYAHRDAAPPDRNPG